MSAVNFCRHDLLQELKRNFLERMFRFHGLHREKAKNACCILPEPEPCVSRRIAGRPKANMSEPPSILIVEDEYPLQGVLESALADAGFASDILASGEEAMTVFVARGKRHKALVTDVYLGGKLQWLGSRSANARKGSGPSGRVHHGQRRRGTVDVTGRAQQRASRKAVSSRAAGCRTHEAVSCRHFMHDRRMR
ncbi:hypothetical protein ACVWYH_001104 [Bradyrhizobium sp. GM24.11]